MFKRILATVCLLVMSGQAFAAECFQLVQPGGEVSRFLFSNVSNFQATKNADIIEYANLSIPNLLDADDREAVPLFSHQLFQWFQDGTTIPEIRSGWCSNNNNVITFKVALVLFNVEIVGISCNSNDAQFCSATLKFGSFQLADGSVVVAE